MEFVVPQMVGLYKDPKGEEIFNKTSTCLNHNITMSSGHNKDSDLTDGSGLRKRVKELEDEVKQKNV